MLIGTFVVETDTKSQIMAEHSQTICLEEDVYWSSTGGLTVHWEE